MINLLKETLHVLEISKKSEEDVRWVGSSEYHITWEEFKKLADIEYDNGYGGQEIASNLLVVGDDWWLEREEYDGSECWEYRSLPKKPENTTKLITKLMDDESLWESLEEINGLT